MANMLSLQWSVTVWPFLVLQGTSKDQIFENKIGIALTMGSTYPSLLQKHHFNLNGFQGLKCNTQYKMLWDKWEILKTNFSNIDSQRYSRFISLVLPWNMIVWYNF